MLSPLANPATARQTGATLAGRCLVSFLARKPDPLCRSFEFMLPDDQIPETTPAKAQWFTTTHWSVVLAAGGTTSPVAEAALERLCGTYWYPLYAFVRREGFDDASAKDLTQGFFARFLEKNFPAQARREKGKFRSFLLASLKHFLSDERRKAGTRLRGRTAEVSCKRKISFSDEARLANGVVLVLLLLLVLESCWV